MIIRGSERSLKKFALKQRVELDSLDPRGLLALMIDWYVSERVSDADPIEEGGDGLLVQWGTYSFSGPETFRYDVTRQFRTSRFTSAKSDCRGQHAGFVQRANGTMVSALVN